MNAQPTAIIGQHCTANELTNSPDWVARTLYVSDYLDFVLHILQTNIALVYSESIEKLKGVLQAMQNASHKREKLEKQLREQLQGEITRLKEGTGADTGGGVTGKQATLSDLQQQILLLETEVAKVRCW